MGRSAYSRLRGRLVRAQHRRLGSKSQRSRLKATQIEAQQRQLLLERGPVFSEAVKRNGLQWQPIATMRPEDIRNENFRLVGRVLDKAGISWWCVSTDTGARFIVGLKREDSNAALAALSAAVITQPAYAYSPRGEGVTAPLALIAEMPQFQSADVWRIAQPVEVREGAIRYGIAFGCDIEVWDIDSKMDPQVQAPRENRAARSMSLTDFQGDHVEILGRSAKLPAVFKKQMLDDIAFPIDVVYTWVDGADVSWLEDKRAAEAELAGVKYHPEANHAARFTSRDELLYSLRSLDMYAPWVRRIYLVTNGQKPDWLDLSNPRLTLVTHAEIYPNEDCLPTFNSNSIISRLHHIPGLSEHYLFMNDDMFFGRPCMPSQFFYANGIARVSASNNRRPFGLVGPDGGPHLNLTKNMRRLLEADFGVTISRAIKHSPYPQLKSVHWELEDRYREDYKRTWASKFRHHDDIVSDQLFHYYAQLIGRAVPTSLAYHYINVRDDSYRQTLSELLRRRDRYTFCLNDAPAGDAVPLEDEEVAEFLQAYFPVPSTFERFGA